MKMDNIKISEFSSSIYFISFFTFYYILFYVFIFIINDMRYKNNLEILIFVTKVSLVYF